MTKSRLRPICTMACAFLLAVGVNAAQNQRFPAPLGLNKVLTGTVSKAKATADTPKDAPRYILTTADNKTYTLSGHDKELKKLAGKKVRITGNAVGENVKVDAVERIRE